LKKRRDAPVATMKVVAPVASVNEENFYFFDGIFSDQDHWWP